AKKQEAGKVEEKDSNPAFDVTHEKSMVIDGRVAFVQSLNWDVKNLEGPRAYAVVTDDKREVAEVIAGFEADWNRKAYKVGDRNLLIWCSGNGRERIAKFIDGAKKTLFVQNERYQDQVIIERLVRAS